MKTMTAESKPIDIPAIRRDFPLLSREVNGRQLVYLDNGATSQKPQTVIDAIADYYSRYNANIHRGVHALSQEASQVYEEARATVQKHLGAGNVNEIIFTRGTTESINLVAATYGRMHVQAGDEVLITAMEHHSNIVPWQMLCEEKNAKLVVVPVNDAGELRTDEFGKLLSAKTKIVALTQVSNTLGTVNPVKALIAQAHAKNIPVLVDGAQAVPHMAVDVRDIDADFYAFSGHKTFGPTGIGVLYVRESILETLPPYQGGGGIIKTVTFEKTEYADAPLKFEAGTPNIEGAIGLAKALDYINAIGLDNIHAYENQLLEYATAKLSAIAGLRIIGTAKEKAAVISFVIEGIHPFDIGMALDAQGIAVRTGHHCTQPLMDRFSIPGTVRASFAFYNTKEEVDLLAAGLTKAVKILA
ncbi:MAG: cysteine desulfurase / selenocysteine lyase [Bacteroidetes bacterium]|nr:MAG: cysteine desulfurase / selenocysteine lyase [Bacteroidota bacterium]